jgi:tungstate transport system ATP-binding protein
MNAEPLYSVTNLRFRYGGRGGKPIASAVEIESLEISKGETIAFVGCNGAGKSTILKLLAFLLRPQSGTLIFDGLDMAANGSKRVERVERMRRCVYLHQNPYILAGSVAYNVSFGRRARGLPAEGEQRAVSEALEIFGMNGFQKRRHYELSGGEARRVALARAIATCADVFMLDEPTSQADRRSDTLVRDAIRALRARGSTVLFSTHDGGLEAELADRTVVLESGRMVAPPA